MRTICRYIFTLAAFAVSLTAGAQALPFVAVDYNDYTSYYQVAWTTENPETLERELASLKAIKDSTPKYLLTTDVDFNPVYDGIRKLNVIDWMLNN